MNKTLKLKQFNNKMNYYNKKKSCNCRQKSKNYIS